MPDPVIHVGESKNIAVLVLLYMRPFQIDTFDLILIDLGKGFKVIKHNQEFKIILIGNDDGVLRLTVDDTGDNWQLITVDQVLVSKILKHRLILRKLLVDLSLLFDGGYSSLKTLLFLVLCLDGTFLRRFSIHVFA